MSLIELLIGLTVVCAVLWGAKRILAASDIGEPLATYVWVVLVIVCVLVVAGWFSGRSIGRLRIGAVSTIGMSA